MEFSGSFEVAGCGVRFANFGPLIFGQTCGRHEMDRNMVEGNSQDKASGKAELN